MDNDFSLYEATTVNLVSQTVNYRLLEAVVDNALIQYLKFMKMENNEVLYEIYRLLQRYLHITDQRSKLEEYLPKNDCSRT